MPKNSLRLIVVSTSLAASALLSPLAATPTDVKLGYALSYAGLPAGRVEVTARLDATSYEIRAVTRTTGMVDAIIGFRSDARSVGAFSAARPVPQLHAVENLWRGQERRIDIAYDMGLITSAIAVPDAAADGREPVAPADRQGTVDPITAALLLMLGAEKNDAACAADIKVFDGRRLYAFREGAGEGHGHVTERGRLCIIDYIRLGGKSDDPWLPRAETPRHAKIWYRRIDERLPPVGVLVTARAGLAAATIRLTHHEVIAVDQ